MVLDYYGTSVSERKIIRLSGALKEKGSSTKGLVKAARSLGFDVVAKENSSIGDLKVFVKKKVPVIVDWFLEDDGHYSVVADIDEKKVILFDPALKGKARKMPVDKFLRVWFDFPGDFMKNKKALVLRRLLAVTPKK
jgi:ABC-type bacteriocin/lantibiotic exporter with double-glycine peptidase domain